MVQASLLLIIVIIARYVTGEWMGTGKNIDLNMIIGYFNFGFLNFYFILSL